MALLGGSRVLQTAVAEGDTRTISLHHIHTDENINITFKRDGRYDEAALEKLNHFLRDWRRDEQTRMDPHLIDLIWEVQRETGSKEPVWVVCGYRSPATNAMLRRRSRGVARFSQHMLGHAMDFYIPGVPLDQLRAIGLRLQRGGVGFYPTSGSPFVHMDTGGVRHWPRMTREQLVRVFPDGRTVHIPTDGRPLAGYAQALADLRKRGSNPSEMSIAAARGAGVDVADAGGSRRGKSLFAKLLGIGKQADDEDEDASAAAPATAAAPTKTATVNEPAPAATAAALPLRARTKAAVVAALQKAGDKLAAQRAKVVAAANKAGAAIAALTPNEIIRARGYWQGPPDGVTATRPASATVNPLEVVERIGRRDPAVDPDSTASLSLRDDHVAPELALAYAEQPGRSSPIAGLTATALDTPSSRSVLTRTASVDALPLQNDTTIAVKRGNGRLTSAVLTVTNKPADDDTARVSNPWLRAVVMSPSVRRYLSTAALGARDFRSLTSMIVKPDTGVMMTFANDPNPGLEPDHFSGSAVVFVSTVTYPTRTAALQ